MRKIRKNDRVKIVSGRAAASGKEITGTVLKVFPRRGKVLIEGYNMVKRHSKPSMKNQKGGIVEKEAPIDISNVVLISPKTSEPARVSFTKNKSGKKIRFSTKLQQELD
jgi:large subunit ribosomal protein L24